MRLRAYLDNNATTQLAPDALAAMMPFLTENYLNASSVAGELAGAARPIADAKRALGVLFGDADADRNFILTSGASEANSWAVHIATDGLPGGHLVSTSIEHPSLLAALHAKAATGWDVVLAAPRASGRVCAMDLASHVRDDTAFVSVMLANNETGVLQPVQEIAALVRHRAPSALLHVDATQAVGRIPLDLYGNLADVDLISLSGHKFHGPKGCGALYVGQGIKPPPLIHGSQQEGRRGGTPDIASAAGLAAAARMAAKRLGAMAELTALRDSLEQELLRRVPGVRVIGRDAPRLPNTSCCILPGVDADRLVEALAMDGVIIASGAACTSGAAGPSHVLSAMGIGHEDASSVVRISLSTNTTSAELELAVERISERVLALA